ncbi:MAG: DAK2 domain-containing protein [Streptosporangiales bacterium]|nr:DAK2 domain-containing protein [Streptosporangiales bacterium]
MLRDWCRAAADDLFGVRDAIDALNVFPVADADTGTNLHLTMTAAADALATRAGEDRAGDAWAALSRAALLGAQGNSGVILSQLLRGVAEHAPADGPALARALRHAADVAYAAVGDPIEGTMLTVATAAASAAEVDSTGHADLATVADAAARGAREALDRTPDQLDVLAEAGVVDAGGAGLVVVLEALARACAGRPREPGDLPHVPAPRDGVRPPVLAAVGPAYEVMYLLDAADDAVEALRDTLGGLGDSLVVVGGDGEWNVHVHVDDAGAAVEAGIGAGRPHRVRVTHLAAGVRVAPTGRRHVVVVVPTAGLGELYESAGARAVVAAGDGAPPTVDEVCAAVPRPQGAEVIVVPGDGSTVAVTADAAGRWRAAGARVAVVPVRVAVQGLAAVAVHQVDRAFDDDAVTMTAAAASTGCADVPVEGTDTVTRTVGAVDRLLSPRQATLVTLVCGPDAPGDLVAAVREHVARIVPGAEVAAYDCGPSGTVSVGVE